MILVLLLLRCYLRRGNPQTGEDILQDAFAACEPGAVQVLQFCLVVRANVRTRRSLLTVEAYWWRLRRGDRGGKVAHWYRTLVVNVLAMFRLWRRIAYPFVRAHQDAHLTHHLPRYMRRRLRSSGAVQVELPTLDNRGRAALHTTWDTLQPGSTVL